jgi:uncharacterized membrane protein YcfT
MDAIVGGKHGGAKAANTVIDPGRRDMEKNSLPHSSQNRVDWVDYAKGICIFAVVTFYSSGYVEETMHAHGWMHYAVDFAQPFRMPDFFMLSGLFMAQVINRPWRSYLNTKVVHFFYFYALWATIKFVLVDLGSQLGSGPYQIFLNYLYLFIQPENHLWFIYILPLFFIAVRLTKSWPTIVVIAIAIGIKLFDLNTGWKMIDRFGLYFVFFYSGYIFSPYLFRIAGWARAHVMETLAILAAWSIVNMILVSLKINWIPAGHLIMGHAGALAVLLLSVMFARMRSMRWLAYLGEHSIVAYLAFVVPLFILRKLLIKYQPNLDIGTLSLTFGVLSILSAFILYWSVRNTPLRFLFERPAWASIAPRQKLPLTVDVGP